MTRRRLLPLATLVALAATLPLTGPASGQGARTLEFEAFLHELESGGYHIVPDQINANVGDTLKLTVRNEGTYKNNIPHDLLVCGDGATPGSSCADKWGFVPTLENNQTAVLTAVAKKAGTFTYYCTLPGHAQAGMRGRLVVAGDATNEAPAAAVAGTLIALAAIALLRRRAP